MLVSCLFLIKSNLGLPCTSGKNHQSCCTCGGNDVSCCTPRSLPIGISSLSCPSGTIVVDVDVSAKQSIATTLDTDHWCFLLQSGMDDTQSVASAVTMFSASLHFCSTKCAKLELYRVLDPIRHVLAHCFQSVADILPILGGEVLFIDEHPRRANQHPWPL